MRSPHGQANVLHRDGELLVRFRAGVPQQEKDTIIATQGPLRRKPLQGESGVEKLELPKGRDAQAAASQILLNPQVEFAEPNFLISKDDIVSNDPRFGEQWALRNTGQNAGQFGSDVNAIGAWKTTTGSKSTVIAVVDSGIDFSHPDLTNNQWLNPAPSANGDLHGWDFVADRAEIKDEHGHGTAVAGIIAAEGNNTIGVTGVMWRASLMSLRVLDNTGTGDVANAVEAIHYAVTHGAEVINLSWGTGGESLALRDALARAVSRNVVVVCSAGNGGRDLSDNPYYPASFGLPGGGFRQFRSTRFVVQLGHKRCERSGAGHQHSHHTNGRWLLECNRHVGRGPNRQRHRGFAKNVSANDESPGGSSCDF
jgi:subtilisin family serine protease